MVLPSKNAFHRKQETNNRYIKFVLLNNMSIFNHNYLLSNLQNLKDTLSKLVYLLLKNNSINIDKEELIFQIKSHPSYPSLHSITGVLDHFNIDNLAIKIPSEKSVLEELPDNFIAQLNTDGLVLK